VKKNLEKLEHELESMREHLKNLGMQLKELRASYRAEEYQKISAQLSELHSKLDALDTTLFTAIQLCR
jgi:predicted nuclease with TOPRIM domain